MFQSSVRPAALASTWPASSRNSARNGTRRSWSRFTTRGCRHREGQLPGSIALQWRVGLQFLGMQRDPVGQPVVTTKTAGRQARRYRPAGRSTVSGVPAHRPSGGAPGFPPAGAPGFVAPAGAPGVRRASRRARVRRASRRARVPAGSRASIRPLPGAAEFTAPASGGAAWNDAVIHRPEAQRHLGRTGQRKGPEIRRAWIVAALAAPAIPATGPRRTATRGGRGRSAPAAARCGAAGRRRGPERWAAGRSADSRRHEILIDRGQVAGGSQRPAVRVLQPRGEHTAVAKQSRR